MWKCSWLDPGNHCHTNKPYLPSLAALPGHGLHSKACHTFGTGDLPKPRGAKRGDGRFNNSSCNVTDGVPPQAARTRSTRCCSPVCAACHLDGQHVLLLMSPCVPQTLAEGAAAARAGDGHPRQVHTKLFGSSSMLSGFKNYF